MFSMIAVLDLSITGKNCNQCPSGCSTSCSAITGTYSGGGLICDSSVGCLGLEGDINRNGGE